MEAGMPSVTVGAVVARSFASRATVTVQLANASQQCAEAGVSHGAFDVPCSMSVSVDPCTMVMSLGATESLDGCTCFAHTSSGPTIIRWSVRNVKENPIERRRSMN